MSTISNIHTSTTTIIPVFAILFGVTAALFVPLIAERFWRCNAESRMMAKADKEVHVYYPSKVDNAHWEYFKPPPPIMKRKNSNEEWEDFI